jgi:iron only hydrogenase large subunit-like protein
VKAFEKGSRDRHGKIIAAARAMGFKSILDTNFGADLPIGEEATELIECISAGWRLPMVMSCCPESRTLAKDSMTHDHARRVEPLIFYDGVEYSLIWLVCPSPHAGCHEKGHIGRLQMRGEVDAVLPSREVTDMIEMMAIARITVRPFFYDGMLSCLTGVGAIFEVTDGVT